MRYGSVCSGIEAATQAWHPLGWKPSFFSEVDARPREVLNHHWPDVPLRGDFTEIERNDHDPIELLVGGTPCQSFSIAGLRKGLDDERGNLALEYCRLAERLRPRWIVWENVPGVLSSGGGRDFGSFLGALVKIGYGFAYRVLDAQYIRTRDARWAVPQRRRRVILVGYLGDWRPAASVLFDAEGMRGDSPPSRRSGQGIAADVAQCLKASGAGSARTGNTRGQDNVIACQEVANPLTARMAKGVNTTGDEGQTMIAFSSKDYGADAMENVSPTLRAGGHDKSHANAGVPPAVAIQERAVSENPDAGPDGLGVRTDGASYTLEARANAQAVAFNCRQDPEVTGERTGPLDTCSPQGQAVAYDLRCREGGAQLEGPHETANMRAADGGSSRSYIHAGWNVRKITPVECERLQFMRDNFTAVPTPRVRKVKADVARYMQGHGLDVWQADGGWKTNIMADGPRYKMLGNTMAVNVMSWVGHRIQQAEALMRGEE